MWQQSPCAINHLHNLKNLINNPKIQRPLIISLNMLIKLHRIKLMIRINIPLLNLSNIPNPFHQYPHRLTKPDQEPFIYANSLVLFVLIYQDRYLLV